MLSNFSEENNRPVYRAIKKEKDGIVLYWIDQIDDGGLHLSGIAKLLEYDKGSLRSLIKGVEQIEFVEAEIITDGGLQVIKVYTIDNLIVIMSKIMTAKIKNEKIVNNAFGVYQKLLLIRNKGINKIPFRKEELSRKRKHKQLLYIMQCTETGVIKIGISVDPLKRLSAIQTGYPYLLKIVRTIKTDKARGIEKSLHKALSDFKLNGEWFDGCALQMIGS